MSRCRRFDVIRLRLPRMLGAHLSISGGYHHALLQAERYRMETVQIFTKNQRQWKAPPLSEAWVQDWRRELRRLGWSRVVSHASYLINLASPDPDLSRKSIDAMIDEIERCEALAIPYLVVHPGSHKGDGEAAGIRNIVDAIDEITRATHGCTTILCLETTVGCGNQIGGRFEHLARILDRVAEPDRVGACFDTCHVVAAGYELSTTEKAAATFEEFNDVVGIDLLFCLHLNDSRFPLGSRRDRHAHILDGHVGRDGFAFVMNDRRFARTPKILETEKGETEKGTPWDVINARRLRRLIERPAAGDREAGRRPRRRARSRKVAAAR